jgi:RNA polymerase sigma factor (sigma-70 family)
VNASPDSVTSITLLWRLQQTPSDQAAWAEFVARYGLHINRWCREWALQEADCQDVAQTVLMKLLKAMQRFRYDPSQKFRAWLKTITNHAWQDLVSGRRKMVEGRLQSRMGRPRSRMGRPRLGSQAPGHSARLPCRPPWRLVGHGMGTPGTRGSSWSPLVMTASPVTSQDSATAPGIEVHHTQAS